MKKLALIVGLLALLLCASSAGADPMIALDLDPVTMGIQSTISVTPGAQFTIDVVITDVDAANPLNGFTFDLAYNPAILMADAVVAGGFLLPTVFVSEMDLTAPDVNFTATTLGPSGASGSGVLSSLTFTAKSTGFSQLSMNDVAISNPSGQAIALAGISGGGVTVTPEPATVLLLATGVFTLAVLSRRQRS